MLDTGKVLFPTPPLAAEDHRVLGEIDSMRERLRHQVQGTPARWVDALRTFLTADAVAASNSIEGFRVSTIDAQDLIAGEQDVEVSAEDREETLAYHQQAQTVQGRWDRSAAVWELLETAVAERGVDPRTVSALHDVAMAGQVRRARYEQAEGLSTQQAQRDLRDLGELGMLAASGRTRARTHVAGPDFPEPALVTARTPMTLTDPYAG